MRGCRTPIILLFVQKGRPFFPFPSPFVPGVVEQSKIDGVDEACTQLSSGIHNQLGTKIVFLVMTNLLQ